MTQVIGPIVNKLPETFPALASEIGELQVPAAPAYPHGIDESVCHYLLEAECDGRMLDATTGGPIRIQLKTRQSLF